MSNQFFPRPLGRNFVEEQKEAVKLPGIKGKPNIKFQQIPKAGIVDISAALLGIGLCLFLINKKIIQEIL